MPGTRDQIEKAIKHYKRERDNAIGILETCFANGPGENDIYRNRKERAQLAIEALEKQLPKKPVVSSNDKEVPKTHRLGRLLLYHCPTCNNRVLTRYETDTPERGYTVSIHYKNCSSCGQRIDFSDLYRKIDGNDELKLED